MAQSDESAPAVPSPAASEGPAADFQTAVLGRIEAYVAAFNEEDAEAAAALWSEDGVYVSRISGERLAGREAIRKQLAAFFAENPGLDLRVEVRELRQVAQGVVVEDARAFVTDAEGTVEPSDYTAIHVLKDGQWYLDSVRETAGQVASPQALEQLAWMVGNWADASDSASPATVQFRVAFTRNRSFLTRTFSVALPGEPELHGTQVIGWDPAAQRIRSWIFDSDGGFGSAVWTWDDDRWLIDGTATLPDGRLASAVFVLKPIDENSFTWQSISRQVDGQILPNVEPITIVRVPTEASTDAETEG